jgi:hypothetical protein
MPIGGFHYVLWFLFKIAGFKGGHMPYIYNTLHCGDSFKLFSSDSIIAVYCGDNPQQIPAWQAKIRGSEFRAF